MIVERKALYVNRLGLQEWVKYRVPKVVSES